MQHCISTFPSTTLLWKSLANDQYISQHSKPQCDECLISRIQNMATFRGPLEWDPATSLGQHTISFYWSTLCTGVFLHGQQQQTHHSICFNQWVNRWYRISLDTIFSYLNLHNGYRITDTCRIRDILLLLFLVLTCLRSMLTFTIRFFTTYYCGWWCRGSTHLQIQWQGWTAGYKTSQESWPVYEMDGNLHGWRVYRSNKHSQKQFLHLDHWIENPKSREHDEHIWLVVKLRIGPVTASLTDWQIYIWGTIAASPSKTRTCAPLDSQSRKNSNFSPLKKHTQKACTNI